MLNACYILHRRAYRETSLLLDVFSYQHGKLSLLAKGAYKAKSAKSAQLQPFQPLLLDWVGGATLKTLSKSEAPRPALQFSGISLYAAMYLNELLYKLLQEEQPMHPLFEAYIWALGALSSGYDVDDSLRRFEVELLRSLGLLPDLYNDWQGNRLEASSTYYLSKDGAFVLSAQPETNAARSKPLLINGADAHRLASILDSPSVFCAEDSSIGENAATFISNSSVKALLRGLIDKALDGKELESRKLVKQFVGHLKN
ncbi:hypothetical protein A3758_07650 [Oleiphilus sp. HI0118]|nr:hypothetical protein A3758_07650 [Oleiphilus sp. HI0118]